MAEKWNERAEWKKQPDDCKSYTVRVLTFFHYRRNRIQRSWKHEEVLTWELVRALDLLPRHVFLKPFLEQVARIDARAEAAVEALLADIETVVVEPYPPLGITGPRQNAASDIGFALDGVARLWIEVKTNKGAMVTLSAQIEEQSTWLAERAAGKASFVGALLPESVVASASVPALSWSAVAKVLESASASLRASAAPEIVRGYLRLADELLARIRSHEDHLLGSPSKLS